MPCSKTSSLRCHGRGRRNLSNGLRVPRLKDRGKRSRDVGVKIDDSRFEMRRVIAVVVPLTIRITILGIDASIHQIGERPKIIGSWKVCPRHQGSGPASLPLMRRQRSNRNASPIMTNSDRARATEMVVKFAQISDNLLDRVAGAIRRRERSTKPTQVRGDTVPPIGSKRFHLRPP